MGVAHDTFSRQCGNRQNQIVTMLNDQERIDVVKYRIENALRTLDEVKVLQELQYYNNAANRLYYAAFYAACALLVANKINTKSHDGVRQMFNMHFVKTGAFPSYFGKYYNELFDGRTTGDYEDLFDHDAESIERLYPIAQEFIAAVKEKVDEWLAENKA